MLTGLQRERRHARLFLKPCVKYVKRHGLIVGNNFLRGLKHEDYGDQKRNHEGAPGDREMCQQKSPYRIWMRELHARVAG
jgi:hypothetical protein